MELQTEDAPTAARLSRPDFELARAAGLQVNWPAESTFNNAVARFSASIAAPLLTEIDRLKIELAELRQVRDSFAAPDCPSGHIEYEYLAGYSTGCKKGTRLICHLEHHEALPATETDPAEPARVTLIAAYHNGVNVLETLVSKGHEICIEEEALREVQS